MAFFRILTVLWLRPGGEDWEGDACETDNTVASAIHTILVHLGIPKGGATVCVLHFSQVWVMKSWRGMEEWALEMRSPWIASSGFRAPEHGRCSFNGLFHYSAKKLTKISVMMERCSFQLTLIFVRTSRLFTSQCRGSVYILLKDASAKEYWPLRDFSVRKFLEVRKSSQEWHCPQGAEVGTNRAQSFPGLTSTTAWDEVRTNRPKPS